MSGQTARQQRHTQLLEKLRREFGPQVCAALEDEDVIEIMANPDGRLWLDRLSRGLTDTGVVLPSTQIELAIGTVAAWHEQAVHAGAPRLKAELPFHRERFQGVIRPVSPPTFVIRKHLHHVLTMDEMIASGTVTPWQAEIIREAIRQRQNIVVAGATLSGKTVLLNTLMDEMLQIFGRDLRLVVIEDTYELMCAGSNVVMLHTCDGVRMQELVQDALRLRPNRIIIGEVRGREALDLLKAWNTGHSGGGTTVHADRAMQVLSRLESLVEEAGVRPNPRMIADAVHLILMMERVGIRQWTVQEIVRCNGWEQHYLLSPLTPPKEDAYVNGRGNGHVTLSE